MMLHELGQQPFEGHAVEGIVGGRLRHGRRLHDGPGNHKKGAGARLPRMRAPLAPRISAGPIWVSNGPGVTYRLPMSAPSTPPKQKPPGMLRAIAAIKIAKGLALAGVALGLFSIVHRDLDELAQHFIDFMRISPENHYAKLLLEKAGVIEPNSIMRAGIATAFYASILLSEGVGLWIGAAWAEYVVVVTTGFFVPEEILSFVHHPSLTKAIMIALNAAILAYVVSLVWRRRRNPQG